MLFEILIFVQVLINFGHNPEDYAKRITLPTSIRDVKNCTSKLYKSKQHEISLLVRKTDLESLEEELAPQYEELGRQSIPIRSIVGLLLLKQIYNLGDETVMEKYIDIPYLQHFCGEIYFQDG